MAGFISSAALTLATTEDQTVNYSAAIASGNLAILCISWASSGVVVDTVTDSQSNTWTLHISGSGQTTHTRRIAIASSVIATAVSTSDTITINTSTGTIAKIARVYQYDVNSGTAIDKSVVAQGTASPVASGTTGTLTQAKELIFTYVNTSNTGQTFTVPSGMTVRAGPNTGSAAADLIVDATSAQNPSWSWTGTTTSNTAVGCITYKLVDGYPRSIES